MAGPIEGPGTNRDLVDEIGEIVLVDTSLFLSDALFSPRITSDTPIDRHASTSRRQVPRWSQVRVCISRSSRSEVDVLINVLPRWTPIEDDDATKCGMPQTYDASKEFSGKKVVLVSVPGAFTPGCSMRHLPSYIQHLDEISQKADLVVVIASNDSFVMAAWGKVNGVADGNKILFMSDSKTFFSKEHGWMAGMADRNGRWAMIIEKDGTVSYAENESNPREVGVSGAEAVMAKL